MAVPWVGEELQSVEQPQSSAKIAKICIGIKRLNSQSSGSIAGKYIETAGHLRDDFPPDILLIGFLQLFGGAVRLSDHGQPVNKQQQDRCDHHHHYPDANLHISHSAW